MLQAALAGFVVWIIINFLEKGEDRGIDGWVSFVLVLVPALMIFFISIAVGMAGLPQWLILLAVLLYLLVPACMLKFQFELPWGRSLAYGAIVLVAALTAEILLTYGFTAISS